MDIKDVRVGDRCWVQWFVQPYEDENGQNAIVMEVSPGRIRVRPIDRPDLFDVSPQNFLWRKPEAPPKPKRMVRREVRGWVESVASNFLPTYHDVTLRIPGVDVPRRPNMKVTVSWEVEE